MNRTRKSFCANLGSMELVLLTAGSTGGFQLENNAMGFLFFYLVSEKYNL